MSKINLTAIITKIQKQLVLSPYDLAHDITHHYRVFAWSVKIINEEKLKIDKNAIILASWLHDLSDRKGKNLKKIKEILNFHQVDKNLTKKIIKIIKEHSFGKKQTLMESKVLYDADKIEYVDPFRLSWFIQTGDDGFIPLKKYREYKKEWWEIIDLVLPTLNFNFSKKIFSQFLHKAKNLMK